MVYNSVGTFYMNSDGFRSCRCSLIGSNCDMCHVTYVMGQHCTINVAECSFAMLAFYPLHPVHYPDWY